MKYFEYGDPGLGFDIRKFLQKSQEQQERHLETELERIEQQLDEREAIFEKHREDLESKLEWYLDRLRNAYKTTGDVEPLKEKVDEFYDLLREERVQHWRDRQELEQERCELLRELRELEDTDLSKLL
jgi:trichohyalin